MFQLIDGGLSTQLELQGVDLKKFPKTWTAGLLESPSGCADLRRAHASYIDAGADIILTSSYQTSLDTEKVILQKSVALTVEAANIEATKGGGLAKVYLSLGPWGATQADGSEYTGKVSF